MGSTTIFIFVVVIALMIINTEALSGECPLASKVYSCSPKCIQDYECTGGKKCCPNNCNAKSCVERTNSGGNDRDKYSQSGGAGTYCNNVKCNSFEVCKPDPATKRMKCQRA